MDTAIVVFAYNRSGHLKSVLEGLKKNKEVDKLYIFQDGLKCEEHAGAWEETKALIQEIDWCKVIYHCSVNNKGLAKSIVDGINKVFQENDTVIVLEDDCVPMPNFIGFMKQCFENYAEDQRIYSVSGYSWPIDIQKREESDIYFCRRISSWGWGTWKDRWKKYEQDYTFLQRMKFDQGLSAELAIWGSDLEPTLIDRVRGLNDSWAVFWALKTIEDKGFCINPYVSLIENIGLDGSGVHCGKTNAYNVALDRNEKKHVVFPKDVDILPEIENVYAKRFGGHSAKKREQDEEKEQILVYGLGNYYFEREEKINCKYEILAFVDRGRKGYYVGKKIIKVGDIAKYDYDKILIMLRDIQENIRVSKQLIHEGVKAENILLGCGLFGEYGERVKEIAVLPNGMLRLQLGNACIKVRSKDEFNNVCEVFFDRSYDYQISNEKKDIILDVGMNIGGASIYFALRNNVEKIYGYEPFRETFLAAEDNLKGFLSNGRVEILNYGISNENATRMIRYNEDMTCGQSTLDDVRERAHDNYKRWGLIEESREQTEEIRVKRASEVFAPMMDRYAEDYNLILKMDCEGEEYGILEDLFDSGILGRFSFIMLEWHYKGKEPLLHWLSEAGMSFWCCDKDDDMGLIYAFKA